MEQKMNNEIHSENELQTALTAYIQQNLNAEQRVQAIPNDQVSIDLCSIDDKPELWESWEWEEPSKEIKKFTDKPLEKNDCLVNIIGITNSTSKIGLLQVKPKQIVCPSVPSEFTFAKTSLKSTANTLFSSDKTISSLKIKYKKNQIEARRRKRKNSNELIKKFIPKSPSKLNHELNNAFTLDSNLKNYKKITNVDSCGPTCQCYYCSLLNDPSEEEDEDEDYEDDHSSEDDYDVVALAYGYEKGSIEKAKCVCSECYEKRMENRGKFIRYKRNYNNTDIQRKLIRNKLDFHACGGDFLVTSSSTSSIANDKKGPPIIALDSNKCTKEELKREKDKRCKAILGAVPPFIREFEDIMRQTREESIFEAFLDCVVKTAINIFSIILCILCAICRLRKNLRRIVPKESHFYNDKKV